MWRRYTRRFRGAGFRNEQLPASIVDVESCELLGRRRKACHLRHPGRGRTLPQPRFELPELLIRAAGNHLYGPVIPVSHPAAESEALSLVPGCGAEEHSLDPARPDKAHAG